MIEFKDGVEFVSVERDIYTSGPTTALVRFSQFSQGIEEAEVIGVDKQLYHLLQQAMPIIGGIVEGE